MSRVMSSPLRMATFWWRRDTAARIQTPSKHGFSDLAVLERRQVHQDGQTGLGTRRIQDAACARVRLTRTVVRCRPRQQPRSGSSLTARLSQRGANSDVRAMFTSIPTTFCMWPTRSRGRGITLAGAGGSASLAPETGRSRTWFPLIKRIVLKACLARA